jgi:quercetin dioxygenase-like cupin family protein
MDATTVRPPIVLTADEIDDAAFEPLGPMPGVVHKVLWRDENSMAGVLKVAAGHHLGAHTHRVNHHHMWVLEGAASILGTALGPGSYAHIPCGTEHDIDASTTNGCTVFYLYIRPEA